MSKCRHNLLQDIFTSDTPHYENVPFEVPEGWAWCKLEDIAYVASGSTPDKTSFVDNGIPYIKMYNLRNQKIDFNYHPQYITEEVHNGKLQRSRTEIGDLIMNIVGPPLGKLAIIPTNLPQANFNQAAVLIRPYKYKDDLVPYLKSYLEEMSEINSIATRGSAGQVNISLTQSQNMRIPIPPLAELKRIMNEFKKYDELLNWLETNTSDLRTIITRTKSKILDLAIHGKLVPQDPNDEPAIELLKRINPKAELTCDNAHYEQLPKGWAVCRIKDIADTLLGKTLDKGKNTGIFRPYLCAINVKWCSFDLSTIKEFQLEDSELERYLVKKGDLLVCEGGDVGRAAIWNSTENIYYQNALHRIRFKYQISAKFFLYSFLYLKNKGVLDDICKGVTIKHLTQNAMNSIEFNLPPFQEQFRIVDKIEDLFSKLDRIANEL